MSIKTQEIASLAILAGCRLCKARLDYPHTNLFDLRILTTKAYLGASFVQNVGKESALSRQDQTGDQDAGWFNSSMPAPVATDSGYGAPIHHLPPVYRHNHPPPPETPDFGLSRQSGR